MDNQQLIAQAETDRAAWFAKWPNACQHCEGHGGSVSAYDPSPAGVSLGAGYMYDFDACEHCVASDQGEGTEVIDGEEYTVLMGKCARCGARMPTEGEYACPACGWNWDQGADDSAPPMPELDPPDGWDW
jgi:ribosomal protein L37E